MDLRGGGGTTLTPPPPPGSATDNNADLQSVVDLGTTRAVPHSSQGRILKGAEGGEYVHTLSEIIFRQISGFVIFTRKTRIFAEDCHLSDRANHSMNGPSFILVHLSSSKVAILVCE